MLQTMVTTVLSRVLEILVYDIAVFFAVANVGVLLAKHVIGVERTKKAMKWHHLYRVVFVLFPWLLVLMATAPRLRRLRGKAYQRFFAICSVITVAGLVLFGWGIVLSIMDRIIAPFPLIGSIGFVCLFFGYVFLAISIMDDEGRVGSDYDPQDPDEPGPPTGDTVDRCMRELGSLELVHR